jgi:hypothetical protein
MRRGALLLLGVMLLAGCVSAFPAEKLVGVDRSVTLGVLRSDPDRFRQARVLLAGEIIQTRPRPGTTEIEVISRPLGDGDAPRFTDTSDGRFLLTAPDFLDPAVYATGRRLSVVGTVTGRRSPISLRHGGHRSALSLAAAGQRVPVPVLPVLLRLRTPLLAVLLVGARQGAAPEPVTITVA